MTLSRSSPNLDQLRGIMARKGGLQRANRFEVYIDNPALGKDRGPGAGVLELSGSYQKLISGSSVSIVFVDTKGDETGNNVKWGMELIEAYPTMIIQEQFSNEMINQFGMLNVSIGFKEYRTKQL